MDLINKRRIVSCAYHNVGYHCLEELLRQGAKIELVFSHKDSPSEEIWYKSVQSLAEENRIPCILTDVNLPEHVALLKEISPDFIFSFYYRSILKKEILEIPRFGALNMHGSYLPRYRGRAPVNWAVINGETETGATLHYMVEKPDAGDIVDHEKTTIAYTDTALDVFNKVTDAAVRIISRTYPLLVEGKASRIPVDLAKGSYFGARRPDDGLIRWEKRAVELYNLIRGVTHPYPGAFTCLDGKKVWIWKAWPVEGRGSPGEVIEEQPLLVGTGEGLLEIHSLQTEGEAEKTACDFTAKTPLRGKIFSESCMR